MRIAKSIFTKEVSARIDAYMTQNSTSKETGDLAEIAWKFGEDETADTIVLDQAEIAILQKLKVIPEPQPLT